MQLGEHRGVPAVGLDPVTGLRRNERRRHDDAVMPEGAQMAIKPVAARTSLIAKLELSASRAKPLRHFADVIRAVRNRAVPSHVATATALRESHRHCRLVHVETHEKDDIVHQVRPPCLRLGAGPSGATLAGDMLRDGPPISLWLPNIGSSPSK